MENKNKLFRFLDWQVYRDAQEIFRETLLVVGKLSPEIRYTLGSQVLRSALSIVLNIAEGSGRGTDKELNRFFNIAIGSVNETVAAVDTLLRCDYISQKQFDSLLLKLESVSRQLGGFKKTL